MISLDIMTVVSFDSILDFIIPLGVVIFIGFVFYGKLKEPIDRTWAAIRRMFGKKKEEIEQQTYGQSILTYK